MSTETNNLKLKKPHIDDYMADTIKDIGDNMEIIDEYLEGGQTLLEAKDLVVQKRDETVILAQQVVNNTQTVSENMQTVLTKAGEALGSAAAALASEQAAEGSKNAASGSESLAFQYMETALQAMQDLLNMLGTDVATLTNGKLTPSQIPALSINDVFKVADTDEMLELTAERGDVALIMGLDEEENPIATDAYILSADDPTIFDNWAKLGISYVANAGHAQTAGNAENADKINNHRLVTMTESQYASAVLENDTLYAVYPDEV